MDRGLWTTALIGFLAPIVVLAPFSPAKAGFFEWLFGKRQPPAISAPAHPDITVQSPTRKRVARRGAAKPVVQIDPKDMLARTIDPEQNPDWWLVDPTLRRGDILFLKGRVVVFVGKKPGEIASYVPVSQTRLVSAKERRQILAMAGGRIVVKSRIAATPKRDQAPARNSRVATLDR